MDIMDKLKEGVCAINVIFEKEEIPEDEGLLSSGMLDSFGFVEFIGFIESAFEIEVGEEEFTTANFKDLMAIKKFIEEKIGDKALCP